MGVWHYVAVKAGSTFGLIILLTYPPHKTPHVLLHTPFTVKKAPESCNTSIVLGHLIHKTALTQGVARIGLAANYRVIPVEPERRPQKTLTDILASSLPFTFSETSNNTRMQSVFTPVGDRSLLSAVQCEARQGSTVFALVSRNSLTT